MPKSPREMGEAIARNLPAKTGKTFEAWVALTKKDGPADRKEMVAWLKSKQDPASGAWPAVSMNKQRPPDSMEGRFMQDAATAFASIVLVETR